MGWITAKKRYVYLELDVALKMSTSVTCHIWDPRNPRNDKTETMDYDSSGGKYYCKLPDKIGNPVLQFSVNGRNSPVYDAEPDKVYRMRVNGATPQKDMLYLELENGKDVFCYIDNDCLRMDYDSWTGLYSCEFPTELDNPIIQFWFFNSNGNWEDWINREECPKYEAEPNKVYRMSVKNGASKKATEPVQSKPEEKEPDKEDNPFKSERQGPKENNGPHNTEPVKRRDPYANLTSLPHSEEGFDLEYQDLKDLDKVVKNCVIIVDTCTFMGLDDSPEAFSNFFARIKPCLEDNGRWLLYHKATAAELARLQKETYNPKDLSSNRLSNRCESARQAVAFIKDNKNLIREYEDTKGAATHADAHFLTTAILNKRDYQFLFLTYDKDCKAALLAENENLSNAGHKILVGSLSPKGKIKE